MSSQITLKDIVKYVVRKWSEDRPGKLVEINDELEPYIVQFMDELHLRHPGHSVIEDIAANIYHAVNNRLKELIHEQQILEQERQLKLQQLYEMAREELLQKVRNNKNESSKDTIIGLKIMEPLTPEMREELYKYYKENWDASHKMSQEERIEKIRQELLKKARTHKDMREPDQIADLKIIKDASLTPEQIAELYKYYEENWVASQKPMSQEERIDKIKEELLRKARTDENRQSSKQIANLNIIKDTPPGLPPLTPEQISELYDYYKETRDVLGVPDVRPKQQRDKDFKTRINEFVQTHRDEMLSLDEFKQIIRDWNRNITIKEAYKYYQNKFFSLPGVTIPIDEPRNVEVLGFKDKDNYKFGTRSYEINPVMKQTISNRFPLKDNLKKYGTHKVAHRGSYMIDFMVHKKKYIYLVAININTRYAMVEMTNITISDENESQEKVLSKDAKTTRSYLRALMKMIDEVKFMNPIRHLTGDGEGAFKSNLAMKFYEQYNITFHPVTRMMIEGKKTKTGNQGTDPLHSSLGLVDRFIRTIRDMIFNAELQITPLAIKEMVRQYTDNTTTHHIQR